MDFLSARVLNTSEPAASRRAVGATSADDRQLLEVVAQVTLMNTQELRLIAPAVYDKVIVDTASPYFQSADAALKQYHEKIQQAITREAKQQVGEPQWYVWAGLVQAGLADTKLSQTETTALREHAAQHQQPESLATVVQVARLKKCYDRNKRKVLLAVTPQCCDILNIILKGLTQNGGQLMNSVAPRGALERQLQTALEERGVWRAAEE